MKPSVNCEAKLDRQYLQPGNCQVPSHHLRVLAQRQQGLVLPAAVPDVGHLVAVAVELVDRPLAATNVPDEHGAVEATCKTQTSK